MKRLVQLYAQGIVIMSDIITKDSYGVLAPCNAPFNNMYFTVTGQVSPCWKTVGSCDHWSEERSISDIWNGQRFTLYRENLKKRIFSTRCIECKNEMDDEVWPLARAYEQFPLNDNGYPSLMELELSNKCNLECVMCSGKLSSGIRKNRDKLPPLAEIYTDAFVDQLKGFIPHLTELRFNGGEPFAQKIVLDICDVVAEINPGLKINMATNGTVINKRVRHIMANNNLHLNISIDSLVPALYEEIRINGKFNKLMTNTAIFADYCNDNKRDLSIMVNPMRNNWEDMVNFVKFSDDINSNLWFNTILYPKQYAIWNLPTDELKMVYNKMKDQLNELDKSLSNYSIFEHLVDNQIKNWLLDSYLISHPV